MRFYISNTKAWAPGIENGLDSIANERLSPKIEFTDPMFRRRFSQITKMTIQVVHDVIEEVPEAKDFKIIFSSFRGEIGREFSIDKMLIEDKSILPAAFSLSVFNTPIAAATIALKLKGGYSVIFPSKGNFRDALLSAAATVLSGDEKKILFAYADEKIPDEYRDTLGNYSSTAELLPLAFACILSSEKEEGSMEMDLGTLAETPVDFLRKAIQES